MMWGLAGSESELNGELCCEVSGGESSESVALCVEAKSELDGELWREISGGGPSESVVPSGGSESDWDDVV